MADVSIRLKVPNFLVTIYKWLTRRNGRPPSHRKCGPDVLRQSSMQPGFGICGACKQPRRLVD